jgi:hypothetical protein
MHVSLEPPAERGAKSAGGKSAHCRIDRCRKG